MEGEKVIFFLSLIDGESAFSFVISFWIIESKSLFFLILLLFIMLSLLLFTTKNRFRFVVLKTGLKLFNDLAKMFLSFIFLLIWLFLLNFIT